MAAIAAIAGKTPLDSESRAKCLETCLGHEPSVARRMLMRQIGNGWINGAKAARAGGPVCHAGIQSPAGGVQGLIQGRIHLREELVSSGLAGVPRRELRGVAVSLTRTENALLTPISL